MIRGRQTRTLRQDQIDKLEAFRRARHDGAPSGYSLPQLRSAMGLGCSWETLQKALQGRPVWDLHYFRIVQWIERFLTTPATDEEPQEKGDAEEIAGAARTIRGSR
jgi:hypothetical protein